jgi:hypothetical protein
MTGEFTSHPSSAKNSHHNDENWQLAGLQEVPRKAGW